MYTKILIITFKVEALKLSGQCFCPNSKVFWLRPQLAYLQNGDKRKKSSSKGYCMGKWMHIQKMNQKYSNPS